MHPIERYRRAHGWTQKQLAAEVGVSTNTVQAWERGATPRPSVGKRLAELLEIDPLQLINEIAAWQVESTTTSESR